jgi:Uma2 family endonuclease
MLSMLAPDATHANAKLPAVDERLVAPETRYEIDGGVLVHVSPAHEPHGSRHSKISALLEARVDLELDVATDMLTRTSETTDVAPDVSVFPVERDPETGGRQLEHLDHRRAKASATRPLDRPGRDLRDHRGPVCGAVSSCGGSR